MFIVYILESKSGKFYYGHTGRSLTDRLKEHRSSENAGIRSMFQEGSDPTIREIARFSDEMDAIDHERKLIADAQYNKNCVNGT